MPPIVLAKQNSRPYLLGKHFKIKTDHQSLKYLIQQKIVTPTQQKQLTKLLGYDFTMRYKKGLEIRQQMLYLEIQFSSISVVNSKIWERIHNLQQSDLELLQILGQIQQDLGSRTYDTWSQEQQKKKEMIVVGNKEELKQLLLKEFHASSFGRHYGVEVTRRRITSYFYQKEIKGDVKKFINEHEVCQRNKRWNKLLAGLLQPLPLLTGMQEDITINFIEILPNSKAKNSILVVVGGMSKYAHFDSSSISPLHNFNSSSSIF